MRGHPQDLTWLRNQRLDALIATHHVSINYAVPFGDPGAPLPRFDEVGTLLMKSLRDLNSGISKGLHFEWPT
jgi:hypothetical protein